MIARSGRNHGRSALPLQALRSLGMQRLDKRLEHSGAASCRRRSATSAPRVAVRTMTRVDRRGLVRVVSDGGQVEYRFVASGVVLDGRLLPGAVVSWMPDNEPSIPSLGIADSRGVYTLRQASHACAVPRVVRSVVERSPPRAVSVFLAVTGPPVSLAYLRWNQTRRRRRAQPLDRRRFALASKTPAAIAGYDGSRRFRFGDVPVKLECTKQSTFNDRWRRLAEESPTGAIGLTA